jgi:hypothetical protein
MVKHALPEWVAKGLENLSVKRELPKWPTLQVVGQDVGPELGREICLRTTQPTHVFSCWDAWSQALADAYGVTPDDDRWLSYNDEERLRGELRILDLEYFGNDRVAASRYELPSGWCDWDGTIGTSGIDLGAKWPSLKELNEELALIAGTWPTLTMTVQLSSYKDADRYEERYPFLTWDIGNGSVHVRPEPGELLLPVKMPEIEPELITDETERGTDIETLRRAIREVKEKSR